MLSRTARSSESRRESIASWRFPGVRSLAVLERPPGAALKTMSAQTAACDEPPAGWTRRESKSRPGQFYYFAESTGENSLGKVAGMDFEERQKYKAQLAKKGEKLGKPQDYIDYEIDNLVTHDHVFFPCTNFIAGPFCEEENISG